MALDIKRTKYLSRLNNIRVNKFVTFDYLGIRLNYRKWLISELKKRFGLVPTLLTIYASRCSVSVTNKYPDNGFLEYSEMNNELTGPLPKVLAFGKPTAYQHCISNYSYSYHMMIQTLGWFLIIKQDTCMDSPLIRTICTTHAMLRTCWP